MKHSVLTVDAIATCAESFQRAALELVFAKLPDELRDAHIAALLASRPERPLDGLLIYCPTDSVEAALFVEPQPGCVASFWGPAVGVNCSVDQDDVTTALIEAGQQWARRNEIELAQTLLSEDAAEISEVYHDAGFTIRAQLDYLTCDLQQVSQSSGRDDLVLVPYSLAERELLAEVIASTYDGTQDCPELNGMRDMQNVLAGYADAGDSGHQHWFFVRCGSETVGVLLLAEHAAQNQAELVYMGVVPTARGRGYGLVLTQLAQRKALELGHPRIILAVDTRNRPALDLYRRAGFVLFDRRTALLQALLD